MTLPLNNPGFTDAEPSKGLINKTFTYIVTLLISIFIAAIISLLLIKIMLMKSAISTMNFC
jgi:hypothetical protein